MLWGLGLTHVTREAEAAGTVCYMCLTVPDHTACCLTAGLSGIRGKPGLALLLLTCVPPVRALCGQGSNQYLADPQGGSGQQQVECAWTERRLTC